MHSDTIHCSYKNLHWKNTLASFNFYDKRCLSNARLHQKNTLYLSLVYHMLLSRMYQSQQSTPDELKTRICCAKHNLIQIGLNF